MPSVKVTDNFLSHEYSLRSMTPEAAANIKDKSLT